MPIVLVYGIPENMRGTSALTDLSRDIKEAIVSYDKLKLNPKLVEDQVTVLMPSCLNEMDVAHGNELVVIIEGLVLYTDSGNRGGGLGGYLAERVLAAIKKQLSTPNKIQVIVKLFDKSRNGYASHPESPREHF